MSQNDLEHRAFVSFNDRNLPAETKVLIGDLWAEICRLEESCNALRAQYSGMSRFYDREDFAGGSVLRDRRTGQVVAVWGCWEFTGSGNREKDDEHAV